MQVLLMPWGWLTVPWSDVFSWYSKSREWRQGVNGAPDPRSSTRDLRTKKSTAKRSRANVWFVKSDQGNGPREKIFFGVAPCRLKFIARFLETKQRQRWRTSAASFIMDGRHPERPPWRVAQPISSADSGERSVAARRSWAAPGLSSGRFVVAAAAIYCV